MMDSLEDLRKELKRKSKLIITMIREGYDYYDDYLDLQKLRERIKDEEKNDDD